jgi:hypothetical protein
MRLDHLVTFSHVDFNNFEPSHAQVRHKHSNRYYQYNSDISSASFLDQVSGELSLVLYTIVDALYSARTNDNYSDRFDDVLWLTEVGREKARDKSLQFYCELIGVSFKRLQDAIIGLLCDTSLLDSNARVNITYRCHEDSKLGKRVRL